MRTLLRIAAAALIALPALGAGAQGVPKYQLSIVAPADGATVFSNAGELVVRATVVPDLAPGDQIELRVDGVPTAPPGTDLEFSLSGIPRGLHQLQLVVLDSSNNVSSMSPSSSLSVWQASQQFPNRRMAAPRATRSP